MRFPAASRPLLTLFLILVCTAVLRLGFLHVPLERDEGEYAYMGQLILRGEMPYVAAYNMKLPGTYYSYAAILAVFGDSVEGIHVGLLLISLFSTWLVYRIGQRWIDTTAGLAAAAAFALLSIAEPMLGFTANAEHFVVLCMLGGVATLAHADAMRRPCRLAGGGFLLGLAFVMKQQGAAFIAFGGLVVLLNSPRLPKLLIRNMMVFAGAAVLPFALTCVGMYLAGAFEKFWFWTFTYAGQYVSIIPLAIGLQELRRQALSIFDGTFPLCLLALLGLVTPLWDSPTRRHGLLLALFAVLSFVAVCPGLRFSAHYFLLLVPATSLLIGQAASGLERTVSSHSAVAAIVGALAITAVAQRDSLFLLSPDELVRTSFGSNPFNEAVPIADYLREHTDPNERIAVIGSEPQIYFYAQRRAATSYIYMYPMMEPQPFAKTMQQEMIAQIEHERPRYLVLVNVDTTWSRRPDSSTLIFDWAADTANRDYEAVGRAEMQRGRVTTYVWGSGAQTAPQTPYHVTVFKRRS